MAQRLPARGQRHHHWPTAPAATARSRSLPRARAAYHHRAEDQLRARTAREGRGRGGGEDGPRRPRGCQVWDAARPPTATPARPWPCSAAPRASFGRGKAFTRTRQTGACESRSSLGSAPSHSGGSSRALHTGVTERWQSGRMYRTRNAACLEGHRGFESHPLRHRQIVLAQCVSPSFSPPFPRTSAPVADCRLFRSVGAACGPGRRAFSSATRP